MSICATPPERVPLCTPIRAAVFLPRRWSTVLWKWTRCSLPAPFIISLSLLQLNELFRKSAAHKDFMSVRVRNLAPSNSILAFVEAHFNPGERPLKTASPVAFICASVVVCSPLSLFKSDNFKKILLDLNEIGHES